MHAMKDWRKKGISLKTTSILMMVISLIITAGLVNAAIRVHSSFRRTEESTNNYIRMENAATELMAASDYLTEEVRHYTVMGNRECLWHQTNLLD